MTHSFLRQYLVNELVVCLSCRNEFTRMFLWDYFKVMFRFTSGVENRRSSGSLPVALVSAAFAELASGRFGMTLFPVPAHRTGQAHLAHPALGERFTVSPTESCLSE
jgi:hypothetical protein